MSSCARTRYADEHARLYPESGSTYRLSIELDERADLGAHVVTESTEIGRHESLSDAIDCAVALLDIDPESRSNVYQCVRHARSETAELSVTDSTEGVASDAYGDLSLMVYAFVEEVQS